MNSTFNQKHSQQTVMIQSVFMFWYMTATTAVILHRNFFPSFFLCQNLQLRKTLTENIKITFVVRTSDCGFLPISSD